jgi:O-methyltransferase
MSDTIDKSYGESLHAFRKKILAAMREVQLTSLKNGISHEQLIPLGSYAPWRDDPVFLDLYRKIQAHTLVDIYRCHALWDLASQTRMLRGDVLEVGVWQGGTAAILGKATIAPQPPARHLWLADTFQGVPKAGNQDTRYKGGEHADTSESSVRELLAGLEIPGFTLLRGVFPRDSTGSIENAEFKLCHIDVDTYESARDVFNWVWPRIVPGGLVVFDDYGFWGCEGVTSFVNELKAQGVRVIYNLNGHALIFKMAPDR